MLKSAGGSKEALHSAHSRPGQFEFLGYSTDEKLGKIVFNYGFDNGLRFSEELDFGRALPSADSALRSGLDAILGGLSIALGISYYKAYLPERIIIHGEELSSSERVFFERMYRNGLGEFAYRNGIDISQKRFFGSDTAISRPQAKSASSPVLHQRNGALPRRSAVMIGGGKDSLVSTEILRAGGEPIILFAVNPKGPISACIGDSGLDSLAVKRRIDPLLFALNESGALNGHVPITGMLSFIAGAGAYIYGYDSIVASNERSANEGNLEIGNEIINHQYSKTISFERDFRSYLMEKLREPPSYFSLLRSLSELRIGQLLAKTDRYDASFSSCNRSFRINQAGSVARWCLNCPKCRFTFLILAVSIEKDRLLKIFGANLLDDLAQLDGYKELSGLLGHKPWECVGEIAESAVSLLYLSRQPGWENDEIVSRLAPILARNLPNLEAVWHDLIVPKGEHFLPRRAERMLNAYLTEL